MATKKGRYKPKNIEKYKGDPSKITYRSGWELRFMRYLDASPSVLEWSSENVVIQYISPKDNRYHRYFTDFYIKVKDKEGKIKESLIEIKPYKETIPPKKPKNPNKSKRYLTEIMTYGVNQAKWSAAKKYCERRGWTFELFTENELNL